MSTGTTLIYNGVIFRNCETNTFQQTIEMDPSGTDAMFSRFRIRVTSTLVGFVDGFQSITNVQVSKVSGKLGDSVPQQMRRLHELLNQSRKDFYFFIDDAPTVSGTLATSVDDLPDTFVVASGYAAEGATFQLDPVNGSALTTVPAIDVVDCNNGPKPKDLNVEQIFGGRTLRVSFEIEVCRKLCPPGEADPYPPGVSAGELNSTGNKVLSNRWSVRERRGEDWRLTRTIDGTLRVASKAVNPHLMRYFVIPTIPRGYQRIGQSFANDPTDLVLKYQIEDREMHEAPPPPAIQWQGHFAESGTGANAAKQFSELQIRLTGPPGVNKQDLIAAAGHVVKSRISGLSVAAGEEKNRPIIMNTSVVEVIGEPIIEMRVRVNSTASETKLATRIKEIGSPMDIDGYHPDVWPTPSPYSDKSLAGVFACYLQSPCSVWHAIPRTAFDPLEPEYEGEEPTADNPSDEDGDGTVSPGDQAAREERLSAPNQPVLYSSNEPFPDDEKRVAATQFTQEPYTYIRIASEYETDSGNVQLPYADSAVQAGGNTCAVVKLHSGVCRRIFTMEATRRDKVPTIPTPLETITDANGITETLEEKDLAIIAPEFGADSVSRKFRVKARHVYLLSRVPTNSEKFRMAISPIDGTSSETRLVEGGDMFSDSAIEWRE